MVTFDLGAPVAHLRSVGERSKARLAKLGIFTVRQLLWHLPSRYEDYSQSVPIADLIPGEKMSIKGRIIAISSRHIWPRRLTITTATLQDDSGAVRAVWFNQPYLVETLSEGTPVSMAGKVVLDKRGMYLNSPVYEKVLPVEVGKADDLTHTGRLVPIYPETEGVTSKYLRYLIQPVLEEMKLEDPVPLTIRRQYGLIDLAQAVKTLHYPDTIEDVHPAKERLAFDDVLLFQLKALHDRRQINRLHSVRVPMDNVFMKKLVATLPFALTKDQRVAALEVLRDMERSFPMNRLLEGDVGSGKTVVALMAALHSARLGLQTVMLAPTEVLAQQHYATLRKLIGVDSNVRTAMLTGAFAYLDGTEASKKLVKKSISSNIVTIIIGTHALLEDDVAFKALGLVVIDEQHRFGIAQRAALTKAGRHADGRVPHLLSMTATPIPRTLALTIFGDLDISIIREKPKGRQTIITRVVGSRERASMYDDIRRQVNAGRQVFVICPRIENQVSSFQLPVSSSKPPTANRKLQAKLDWSDVKAVEEEYQKLKKEIFPDLKIAMLHGRMKAKEKQAIMHEFKEGWQDILVSTSVIEVGVDIPNATIMLVEGADLFGLAQLHQFRGRVGRDQYQSYCYLIPSDNGAARARLSAMEKTDDGFLLAEADMKLRGPGEFFGIKQSGLPDLTMMALANVDLIKKARTSARAIMKSDPELKRYPLLKAQLDSFRKLSHFE